MGANQDLFLSRYQSKYMKYIYSNISVKYLDQYFMYFAGL